MEKLQKRKGATENLRWCYKGRFATTILAQHSVAMLEQCCNHSKQCRNNVATLCCAKNRRCESSRVTSPLNLLRGDHRRKSQKAPGCEAGSPVGCFTVYYCWFVADVTAAILLDKNKRVALRWELNSCFVDHHGRLVTWFRRGSQ